MADIQPNGARVDVPPSGVVAASDRRTDFMVHAHPSEVSNYARDGNDLVLHLRDGGMVRIQGFFAHGVDFNHLVFVDGGSALPVDLSSALTLAGDGIDDAQVITGTVATPSGGVLLPVLGALALGAVGVGSLKGGGSDTPPLAQPRVTVPDAPQVALLNDTGAAGDKISSDGKLNLSGIETGATATYSTDGGKTWAASFTPVEGVNDVQVRQTDAAGNVSAATDFSFTLDTQVAAPTVALRSDTGTAGDKISSDGGLNVTGIEAGATVGYSTDGGRTWAASFTPVEGVNDVQVRQTDAAGNVSAATDFSFTLDTQVAAPVVALRSDTGTAGDKITSDGGLNVTGIEAGATVGYSTDGGKTWAASFTPVEGVNDVQVRQTDAAGNVSAATDFSFTLDTQVAAPTVALRSDTGTAGDKITSDGGLNVTGIETGATVTYSTDGGKTWAASFTSVEGVNDVLVRQTDLAGNVSAATAFSFTLEPPQVATPVVALAHDTGDSTSDKITNDGTLTLSGIETGATVQYSTDDITWSATAPTWAQGSNTVYVRQTDVAGHVSDPSQPLTFTYDTSLSDAAQGVKIGWISPDTSDTSGLWGYPSRAGHFITSAQNLSIGVDILGALNSDERVQINLGDGVWHDIASSSTPGFVLYDDTSVTLDPGTYTFQVRVIDTAGNTTAPQSQDVVIDTSKPPALTVALTHDTGVSNSDGITNDGTLTLSGFEDGAGYGYNYFVDGVQTVWTVGGGTPAQGGTVQINVPVTDGDITVQVWQVDLTGNGNQSPVSSISFKLDTQAAAPTVALLNDTGTDGDKITSDGRLNVSGIETGATVEYSTDGGKTWATSFTPVEGINDVQVRQTDVAGNVSTATDFSFTFEPQVATPVVALAHDTGDSASDKITNNGTLTLSGIETGATVQYSTDDITWSATAPTWAQGSNTVYVRQTDAAGHVSAASQPLSFNYDTSLSDAAQGVKIGWISPDTSDISGLWGYPSRAGHFITSAQNLSIGVDILGALNSDERVQINLGDGVWHDIASSSTPGFVLYDDTSVTLDPGTYTFQARVIDTAGNTTAPESQEVVIDTSKPPALTVALTHDTGVSNSDGITNDGTLTLSGFEDGGGYGYNYFVDGALTALTMGAISVQGDTVQIDVAHTDGDVTVQVWQVDVAGNGNQSPVTSISFTLDTQAAAPTVALLNDTGTDGDKITSDGTLNVTGLETGATVAYSTDGGAHWSATFTPAEGDNDVLVRQTDVAGNVSAATDFSFTLESQPETSATILTLGDYQSGGFTPIPNGTGTTDTGFQIVGELSAPLGADEHVVVLRNGEPIGTALVSGADWAYTDAVPAYGDYTYTAFVENAAGSSGPVSDNYQTSVNEGFHAGAVPRGWLGSDSDDTVTVEDIKTAIESPQDGNGVIGWPRSSDFALVGDGGNDTYNLLPGHAFVQDHAILRYDLIDPNDPTGGNGSDVVNGFVVGDFIANANADQIDLRGLLSTVTGNHSDHVSVTTSGANTLVSVDLKGDGSFATVLTINDVHTTLAELTANQQIVM